ncbi:MAG TPA: phage holin family protein [Candidatus Dormibacteraeota bacterium]|nr:phage holin family protein [Candidatus Dormibacteraeota bacterium]HXL18034.1 phage holin family protein [Streptosporangiaceae bacterium]
MLTRFLVHIVALLFVFYVVWGIRGSVLWAAVLMALILAVVNTIIRPVLLILTLPVTILTLGLFVIVLNALLFGLSFAVLQGILNVHFALSFFQILIGYLIYVIVSTVLTRVL